MSFGFANSKLPSCWWNFREILEKNYTKQKKLLSVTNNKELKKMDEDNSDEEMKNWKVS